MAQSDDTPLSADGDEDREQRDGELSEGEARLVIRENDVTVTIEGDSQEVRRRYHEHMANALDTTVEELTADVEDYPHPAFGDGLVPADEFYDEAGRETQRDE